MNDIGITCPEIMAPAGEWSALHAALNAGADAVYFGVAGFNMRAAARNFDVKELPAIVRRCHYRGCRAYLTLNTQVYDHEFDVLDSILCATAGAGVDAVIASDLAVIEKAVALGMEVHLSTQMSVSNSRSILFYHRQFGIRRFVLARECSLADMALIRQRLETADPQVSRQIEFEVFAHGAMCVSVSGRCYLSQFHYGKSANRGECLQPCRREFRIEATDEAEMTYDLGTAFAMSPQDLCTLPFLEALIDEGVAALKIEGRGRSPEYVGFATQAYREVATSYVKERGSTGFEDRYEALKQRHLHRLQQVYNRGFSNGFYMGKPMSDWTTAKGSVATARKEYIGLVVNYYRQPGTAEVCIHGCDVRGGDRIYVIGNTTGALETTVESIQRDHEPVEVARKGMTVAIKISGKVRRNDKLYLIVPSPAA